jgi:hypothetical protein
MDDGALLLSEQLGYPAAFQRHLEQRDPDVLALIPPDLAARWVVLPLARARTGAIVVVARDPSPVLCAALEHAMRETVVLAVTPAVQLERMVRAVFALPAMGDAPLPSSPPTLSDIGGMRVADATPLPPGRARTVSYMFKGLPDLLHAAHITGTLEQVLQDVDRAVTVAAAERTVMAYAATRWTSALLMRIETGRADGLRGHGTSPASALDITIPLAPSSMLSLAHDARQVVLADAAPVTPAQEAVAYALSGTVTAAAPVIAAGEVPAVLAVGAPIENTPDLVGELDRLVDALGAAYGRFAR